MAFTALIAIGAGSLLDGPRVSAAEAQTGEHAATAIAPDPLARGAAVSGEAEEEDEEEQEETAAKKIREEDVTATDKHEGEVAVEHAQGGRVAAKPASVTIEGVKVTASGLEIAIETSRAGTVTFTGPGLERTVRTLPAESHHVKVGFVRGGRIRERHPRRITLAVSLTPSGRTVSSSREIRL
jgi:hypothetical protein